MDVRDWLFRQARAEARGKSALWAGRCALIGVVALAVALFCVRAGLDVPGLGFLALPEIAAGDGVAARVLGYFVLSTAALVRVAAGVAAIFAAALVLRVALPPVLRRAPRATAARLDRTLSTERFSAALEATGPLAPLVEREAWDSRPPDGFLRPRRGGRALRWLNLAALALLFVLAVLPGVAPGQDGDAPVLGAPDPGQRRNTLRLVLEGPVETLQPDDPILLALQAEMSGPPTRDLELPVFFVLDGKTTLDARESLFLPAGGDGRDDLRLDLGPRLPPLAPGEHQVFALAGGARSNVWTFRVESEGGGGGAEKPKPGPEPKPEPEPEGGAPAMPELRPKFVEPLVREGDTVEKMARVPIEVPGGGAPRESTLEEAWPELERRREAALNRAGLSPAARDLVRRYFEELRPKAEGGR